MPKKSLAQKISEAIELSDKFNKALNTLPPEIRQIIVKYSKRAGGRRRRRRGRRAGRKKQKQQATPS
jgi:mRNA-degrading endonuclease RelE of RelBE toxin-antitoxin system